MKINEVAKLTGITVRTLHYYDEIGLLHPSQTTEAGYRIYDNHALDVLQQILFFRELEFSLNDIKDIMKNPSYNKKEMLSNHKEILIKKRNRLNDLIILVESTLKGENDMSFKQFDMTEIEKAKTKYAEEVKERWGDTEAYAESEKRTSSYDHAQWEMLNSEGAAILKEFSEKREQLPDSNEVQVLVKKWQVYITDNFYNCTKEILSCLGLMYIGDERFKLNLDKNGEGTAKFMAEAIAIYCTK
ncbi:MerR family transcriptional regulator [Lachnospiraceae bacterium LCP25S3_G4]